MKTPLLILLSISGLLACKKDSPAPYTFGQQFDAVYQQPTTLPVAGSSVRITLTEVLDSRCPANAYCIWAGYAAVALELTDASATPQTVRISLHYKDLPKYATDSAAITLNQQNYWLRLLDVTPYPGTSSKQPQTATLRLRPR